MTNEIVNKIISLTGIELAELYSAFKNKSISGNESENVRHVYHAISSLTPQQINDVENEVYKAQGIDPSKLNTSNFADEAEDDTPAVAVTYEARLKTPGTAAKRISVIQQIKTICNISLGEAKAQHDALIQTGKFVLLKAGLSKEDAEKISADPKWAEADAKVEVVAS